MAISYTSQILKSSPYILPVDLNLTAKILQFKESTFKQNASKIQQSIDQAEATDVLKPEDKEYLNHKLDNLVNGINNFGGVDLGDSNVVNQLNQMTSDIYSDQDLLTSITSTQQVRKLTSLYEKMQTDPKLKDSFATQNKAWDMQAVNSWLNNGQRTTVDTGYNGPSSPTPYTDIDKLMVERAKIVKSNYTKSSTKDGIYIHNTTGEEVTADKIQNELRSYIQENPQLQQQAQINSWFINRDITGQDLYNEALFRTTSKRDFIKKDYEESLNLYNTMSQDQKIKYAQTIESKKQNLNNFDKAIKDIQNQGIQGFEKNKDAYRTSQYIENMTDHLAQSMSFNKFTDEVKPDLAQLALMKNQLEAAKIGAEWAPDPTNPSGWTLIKSKNPIINSKNNNTTTELEFDITKEGQLSTNLNTENKEEWNDKKVAEVILEKQDQKQMLMQGLTEELITLDPSLAGIFSKEAAQSYFIEHFKKGNDPDRFEIEDLKNATSKWMSPAQTKYVKDVYDSYEAIKQGKKPSLNLTANQLETMKKIHSINEEVDFYNELLNDSKGLRKNKLTLAERAALIEESTGVNMLPEFKSAKTAKGINGGLEPFFGVDIQKNAPTLDVLFNKETNKFIPTDGKEHVYKNITIPTDGITAVQLEALTAPGGARLEKSEIDPSYLYGVNIFRNNKQLLYKQAVSKAGTDTQSKNLKAYDVLNEVSGFYNYAIPSGNPSQSKGETLDRIKTGILQEFENGSIDFTIKDFKDKKYEELKGQQDLSSFDKEKSYVSRVGTSTSDPTKLEVEITMMSKGTNKAPSSEVLKISRELTQKEAAQIGLPTMPREYLLDNTMVKYRGRTAPTTYLPQTKDPSPQLAVDMEVVYLKPTNSYVAQIKVPINGKMEYITLGGGKFPDVTGSSVNETKLNFQKFISNAYEMGVKSNNDLYQIITE